MTRSIRSGFVGLLVVGAAACTGAVNPGSNPGTGTGAAPGAGTGGAPPGGTGGMPGGGTGNAPGTGNTPGTGSGGAGPGMGSGGAPIGPVTTCTPGIPATSQIPRMTVAQYGQVIQDLFGITSLTTSGNATPGSFLAPDSAAAITDIAWNGYLTAAEKIAAEVMGNATAKAKFIACDPAAGTCLADTVKAFGRKVFRRPLTTAEQTSFMRLNTLTPKGTPTEVAEAILYAFLASPSFISLPELAQEMDGSSLKLNSYEVAARLSFLLWNSLPDEALSTAADMGQLTTKEQIRTQAMRMLQSPKAAAVASTFHKYYADIQPGSHWVNVTTHNATKFPGFTAASYTAAMTEIDSFFREMVTSGATFKDLFTSPVAFVSKDTASIYGVTQTAASPTKMMLDATKRPGFLTRVGFLSTFSHDDSSSPILRGAFISGRVLGIPTGTPDPSFLGMKPPAATYTTNRDATDALTMPAPCNSCHTTKINPPGYVLERFNAIGAWQDMDALGGAINSTADVYLTATEKKTITSPAELMAALAAAPQAQRIYAQQWVAFASGRNPNTNDACVVDTLVANMASPTYPIAGMMADYTQADSFRLRTLGN